MVTGTPGTAAGGREGDIAHFWSWLEKVAIGARVARVPGPHCLSPALTLPPEEEGESNERKALAG